MACVDMKRPDKFELDVQSTECVLDALDVVREAFLQRHHEEGLSKKEFSDWLGKHPSYVSRVLNGRVTNVNYKTIAQMLLALRYFPELSKADFSSLDAPSNYFHSCAARDHYTRYERSDWTAEEEKGPDNSYKKSQMRFMTTQGANG